MNIVKLLFNTLLVLKR